MKKNSKIIVSIVGITIVLLALLGLTYAYYLTRIEGNTNTNSISVTTANLELVYGDNSAEIIRGTGALMPDSDNPIGTKTFTVTNNGNDSSYVVIIDNVSITKASDGSSTTFVSNDFRYTLTCKKSDNTNCNNVSDLTIFPIKGGILVSNDIKAEDVHTYTLTMWYIDTGMDQSADMNKELNARVNIADINQMENPFTTGVTATDNTSLAYNIIKNAKEKKNGTELTNTPLTSPANETSKFLYKTHEAEIATTESSVSINTTYQSRYWTYATDYIVDETTGKFSLVDPKVCLYNDTDLTDNTEIECDELISTMVSNGETIYILSTSASSNTNTTATLKTTTNKSNIYLVTTAPVSSTSTITMKAKILTSISYSSENSLSLTTDDYGISYYYRGLPEDNYVTFAGMCWRIVRIDGNGNTKLILEDQDEVCSTTMNGNWNIEASDGTNITLKGTEPYRTGNFGYDDSTGKYKMSYLNPVTQSNKAMVNAFKYFQTNTLTNKITSTYIGKTISDFLVSGNWCLNNKAYSDVTGTTLIENPTYTSTFYYDSYVRLYGKTTKEPTLKCPVETMETFGDNTTPMYVGALTADEIVYAGGIVGSNNPNYYLINKWQNSNSKNFWSLSPYYISGDYGLDYAFIVNENGRLSSISVDNSGLYMFRPSVSLVSSAVISSGEGTLEKPYVIG